MMTRGLAVGGVIVSALVLAGCKQETKGEEPIRPVLSTVLKPAVPGSAVAVGTVEPRTRRSLASVYWDG
jgi:uncharacterized lipoprotein YajG